MRYVRKIGKRIPGAWTVYKALRRTLWEGRAVFHGIRTGRIGTWLTRTAPPAQRARHADDPLDVLAAGLYPPDAQVTVLPVSGHAAMMRARAIGELSSAGDAPQLYDWVDLGEETAFVTAAGGEIDARRLERITPLPPDAAVQRVLDRPTRERLHFGREHLLRGRRYLYQSVPGAGESGRRDTRRRWVRISEELGRAGISVEDRLVLDVGCNAGMMLAEALEDGAAWGLGWDMPDIAAIGRRLLAALGFTRYELFGASLSPDYRLADDVPEHLVTHLDGSIVFYLAIRHHVGFVADLAELPWSALVYEGSELETTEGLEETLAPLRERCEFRIASAFAHRDGEGRSRPLAVLVRQPLRPRTRSIA
jgi:hypothetical protein